MEKCGKMCENVLETRFLYTTNYDDEYIRIEEAMRSVTHPLDNAALGPLATSSQLIGEAVQEDR